MSIFIWPSEAALLGRTLEEYLEAWEDDDDVCFLDFLNSRLGPFFPPPRLRSERVDEDDWPSDLGWETTDIGTRFGFAPSLPDSWFLGADATDFALRITRDLTHRILPELVAERVASHVARNAADDAQFNLVTGNGAAWGLVQQQGMLCRLNEDEKSGADQPLEIEKAISSLAAEHRRDGYFRAGRAVGRLLAECHRYEAHFLEEAQGSASMEGFSPVDAGEWRERVSEALDEFWQTSACDESGNAGTLLRHEQQRLKVCVDPDDWTMEMPHLETVRAAVWLAFGEILQAARREEEAAGRPAPKMPTSAMLRAIHLTHESSCDKIRNALASCEEMFDDRNSKLLPEQIVTILSPGIEALARRVWRGAFERQGPRASVYSVLTERCRSTSGLEQKLARLALTLYQVYRNPSQHDFDAFHCDQNGALFFLTGMRELWELSEQIQRMSINEGWTNARAKRGKGE